MVRRGAMGRPGLGLPVMAVLLVGLGACAGAEGPEAFQNDRIVSTAGDVDTKTANGVCFETERTVSLNRFPRRVAPQNCGPDHALAE